MQLIPPVTEGGAAFVIDRTPVTVQAYRACVGAGACPWREPEDRSRVVDEPDVVLRECTELVVRAMPA